MFLRQYNIKFHFAQIIIKTRLDNLLSRHCYIESKLQNINKVLPKVVFIHSEAKKFQNMIVHTNKLAGYVSSKVRQLDLARVSNK